ncbi:MAG: hypothetical protein OEZ48_03480 [Candidatus Bathyarchaeota archaeon]|nr:hypothetical protein [Candidatus Bathyarchaeota archaeon]MDH5686909.1 hypothetical protein [Candidatus Bathyarchaeota archaeon]
MVFEKMYKAEDGTYVLLIAENEEQMAQWDLERLTMLEDPRFARKVEEDCEELENLINKANEGVNEWMRVEDFVEFRKLYDRLRPEPYYDFRYPYTPSRTKALRQQLRWILSLLRNFLKRIEEGYYDEKKPKHKPKKQKLAKPTFSDTLKKLDAMEPDERSEFLADAGPDTTVAWMLNRLEKRRAEETEAGEKQEQDAIKRFGKIAQSDAEKLSGTREAETNLREILEKWVQHRRTR